MPDVKRAPVGGAPTTEICYFKAGDTAPPWLITGEPLGPGSEPLRMLFTMDVSVVKAPPGWWVLPADPMRVAEMSIVPAGGRNVAVLAPGDTVVFPSDAYLMPGNPNVADWVKSNR